MTKQDKVLRNLKYAREQAERFLKYEYRIQYPFEVLGDKQLEKSGYYSKLEFKNKKPEAIILSYQLLLEGKKDKILLTVLREAIKIALWYQRKPYEENSEMYIHELNKYKLPVYGELAQTGKDLHTYACGNCEKIYFLRDKKLPKSKDVTLQNVRTSCCKERFIYKGKIHYSNKQLQTIAQRRRG